MSANKPSLVLIVEKPAVVKLFAPYLRQHWPDKEILVVCTFGFGLYGFEYPRGLAFKDVPFVETPQWKRVRSHLHQEAVYQIVGDQARKTALAHKEVISAADEIWFAGDADHTGAIGYQNLLNDDLGEAVAKQERPALAMLQGLDPESIIHYLGNPTTTHSSFFQGLLSEGEAKRYFEYNFNVNSMILFGECLRRSGVEQGAQIISKYGLQLLYHIKNHQRLSEVDVYKAQRRWKGTGRYKGMMLGSAASFTEIFSGLVNSNLVDVSEDCVVTLSEKGERFLGQLHPDCEDADLPARLNLWMSDWPSSKEKMSRYLRTYFGKQERFMGRR